MLAAMMATLSEGLTNHCFPAIADSRSEDRRRKKPNLRLESSMRQRVQGSYSDPHPHQLLRRSQALPHRCQSSRLQPLLAPFCKLHGPRRRVRVGRSSTPYPREIAKRHCLHSSRTCLVDAHRLNKLHLQKALPPCPCTARVTASPNNGVNSSGDWPLKKT